MARVSERAGLFRVGARVIAGGGSTTGGAGGAGLYALPVQELCAGAWAMRPLQDCKHARLPRTKTAHYFDLLESGKIAYLTPESTISNRKILRWAVSWTAIKNTIPCRQRRHASCVVRAD